jgi:uncharacterized tellurite resistance protein B-like protein/ribosomal protein S27AE
MYIAHVDGQFSPKEKEFYWALLSRMSFDEHTQAKFQKMVARESNILEAIAQIEDDELRSSLIEVLVLMVIYDGELAEQEREFLIKVANTLNVSLDIDEVERKTEDYRVVVERSILRKTAGIASGAAGKVIGVAGQAAGGVKTTALGTGSKVKGAFSKVFNRGKKIAQDEIVNSRITCPNCGNEIFAGYRFCPNCGQSVLIEK